MGITASTTFDSLNSNKLLLRLVGPEHVELNDSFWTDVLSFTFSAPLKSEDSQALADATKPLCSKLMQNGVTSGNLYTLVQLFVWRCDLLCHAHQSGETMLENMSLLAYNSLLLIRQLTQHLLFCCTEDQLQNYFNPPAPSPPNSPALRPLQTEAGTSAGDVDRTSPTIRGARAAPPSRSDSASSTSGSAFGGKGAFVNQARLMATAESGYAVLDDDVTVPLTQMFADGVVIQPSESLTAGRRNRKIVTAGGTAPMRAPQPVAVSDTLASDRIDGSVESLLDTLCLALGVLPAEGDTMHNLIVECMQTFLVLLSTQQDGRRMGFALDHLVMNCNCAKDVVRALLTYFVRQPEAPEKSTPNSLLGGLWSMVFTGPKPAEPSVKSPLGHLSLHLLLVLTNYFQQKGQKNPFHFSLCFVADDRDRNLNSGDVSFPFNMNSLYNALCSQLTNDQATLLLYLLLHSNFRVASYILSRTDIENLVLPVLHMLYSTGEQSQSHIYMMLIVVLILTQDEQFNRAIHEIELKMVPWFKERSLGAITLGSLMILVVLRTIQYNMAKLRDKFLHNNCLAALANMSASVRNIHPFAAQRLLGLFEALSKKHQRVLRVETRSKEAKELSSSAAAAASNSDEQAWDVTALEEVLRTLLEIMNAVLTSMLVHNPHLIYALLHRQRILAPYSTLAQFSDIMSNIDMVLTFFCSRLEDSGNASVDDVLAMIGKGVRQWPHDCLARFPDLRFKYVEEEHSEEFFIPYIWQLVHASPLLHLKKG